MRLVKARKPIVANAADRTTNVVWTEHGGNVDEHADHIIRYVNKVSKTAREIEYRWIVSSAQHLRAMILNPTDPLTVRYCTDSLIALGWKKLLRGFINRLAPALRANLPPYDGTTRKQRKALRRQRRRVEGVERGSL